MMEEQMKKYIGVKMVEARPMGRKEYVERGIACSFENMGKLDVGPDDPGYMVCYPGGYVSWCPEDPFEAAYFGLEDPSGTKICAEDVLAMMGPVTAEKLGTKTTFVRAEQTAIGFDSFAHSSCVDPANYSEKIGVEEASKEIQSKFWMCLGFVLQWAKNGVN